MCEACDSTKREIDRLAEWKGRLNRHRATIDKEIKRLKEWKKKIEGQCGAKPRKQYFKKYYAANRAKKIEAAKERYLSQRSLPQPGECT